MSIENTSNAHSLEKIDEFDADQNMAEWFPDYLFGFTEEPGSIPDVTVERLARQFGTGEPADQLTKMRELLLASEDEHQPPLALYICGYPNQAFTVLSELPLEEVVARLDEHAPPAEAGLHETRSTSASVGERQHNKSEKPKPVSRQRVGDRAVKAASEDIGSMDSLGLYLKMIGQIPLIDAEAEVEHSKRIEAGLYAKKLLESGEFVDYTEEELAWLVGDGSSAREDFISANLRLVVSVAKKIKGLRLLWDWRTSYLRGTQV